MHSRPASAQPTPIPASLLLQAYRAGIFPMADGRDDPECFWVEPRRRAIIPLADFSPSRSLRRTVRRDRFAVSCDTDFAGVIDACATAHGEDGVWISRRIEASYIALHHGGHAHSIEVRDDTGTIVGGLYGVAFDRVFCGESMFSKERDASKVALVWLVAGLKAAGYEMLDCQFMTDHLASMGAVELDRETYRQRIAKASGPARLSLPEALAQLVQSPVASSSPVSPSSPGNSIAQSFTNTS